ncbi:MAG: hypothetical protein ACI841_001138 [Planctomycetota bacterium]|jgi:hypothetical protein
MDLCSGPLSAAWPPPLMPNRISLLCLPLLLASCRFTVESTPAGTHAAEITVGSLVATWRVTEEGETRGWLRRYSAQSTQQGAIFVVQNEFEQDLGYVDSHGRAWRRLPHQEKPQWLTTGTVLVGVGQILGIDSALELVEMPVHKDNVKNSSPAEDPGTAAIPDAGLKGDSGDSLR